MSLNRRDVHVLLAEDDPDDRLLIRRAFHSVAPESTITMVPDGEEVLDYLYRRGRYCDPAECPWPSLILLDLNMPRKDGHQVVREIKAVVDFRSIPIVVLSTSVSEQDISLSYELGVNAFISKPPSFSKLKKTVRSLSDFWFEIVKLPPVQNVPF
jgi:CheY-like chemotaxis protein